jgi:hypothetical protein
MDPMRCALVFGVISLLATVVAAQTPPQANAKFRSAQDHYNRGQYAEAIADLRDAFAVDPQPQYLWAMAQAFRQSGDCARALEQYRAYLRSGPKPAATMATQALIDECETALGPRDAATPQPPAPAPATPTLPSAPMVIREVQRVYTRETIIPWYRDWIGDSLAGASLVGIAAGTIFLVEAKHHDDDATNATTFGAARAAVDARDRANVIGGVAIASGVACAVGALARYALRPKRVKTEVYVEPTGDGVKVGIAGRWP